MMTTMKNYDEEDDDDDGGMFLGGNGKASSTLSLWIRLGH